MPSKKYATNVTIFWWLLLLLPWNHHGICQSHHPRLLSQVPFFEFQHPSSKIQNFNLEKFEFILPERRSREKRQDWYCYHGSLFRCFQFEMLTILLLHYVDRQGQMDPDLASLWYLLSLGGHGGIPRSSPSKWKIHITKLSLNVHTFTLKLRIPCPIGKVASPLIFKGCPALCFALVSTFSSVFPVRSTG